MNDRCFICGESLSHVSIREIAILNGALTVLACGPCVDLPDTNEFVQELIIERLMPAPIVKLVF